MTVPKIKELKCQHKNMAYLAGFWISISLFCISPTQMSELEAL
jgi:hypothetical protein